MKKIFNRSLISINILAAAALVACSHQSVNVVAKEEAVESVPIAEREIASSIDLDAAMQKVYYAYLHGYTLMEAFDRSLDSKVQNPLKTKEYAQLLAVRSIVDGLESNINSFYFKLVKIMASNSDRDARDTAQSNLNRIYRFMNGYVKEGLPALTPGLQFMVLGNIQNEQKNITNALLSLAKIEQMTSSPFALVYQQYASLMRATRMAFLKRNQTEKLSPGLVHAEIEKQAKNTDFQSFKAEVEELGSEIHSLLRSTQNERNPSSLKIVPSAGAAGNITGNGYPANTWSMTYDDGPGATTSLNALNNLNELGVKATFFQLAQEVITNNSVGKKIWDAKMDIACHSWNHPQVPKLGPAGRHHQIEEAVAKENAYLKAWNDEWLANNPGQTQSDRTTKLKLYRLPYGAGTSVPSVRQEIADQGLVHVFWNVDTLDWQDKNPATIYARAMKQINSQGHGIILFHDIHPQSVIASKHVLETLKANNKHICTVQSVIDQINLGKDSCEHN